MIPIGTTEPAVREAREVKAICVAGPVKGQCLSWALDSNRSVGIWGGLTERERPAKRRRTLRAEAGVIATAAAGRQRPPARPAQRDAVGRRRRRRATGGMHGLEDGHVV
jgi:WhiB family transcriptional regulator, redox-sensing transcriptional regulator